MKNDWGAGAVFRALYEHAGPTAVIVIVLGVVLAALVVLVIQIIKSMRRIVEHGDAAQQAAAGSTTFNQSLAEALRTHSESEMVLLQQLSTLHVQQTEVLRHLSEELRRVSDAVRDGNADRQRDTLIILQTIAGRTPRKTKGVA